MGVPPRYRKHPLPGAPRGIPSWSIPRCVVALPVGSALLPEVHLALELVPSRAMAATLQSLFPDIAGA